MASMAVGRRRWLSLKIASRVAGPPLGGWSQAARLALTPCPVSLRGWRPSTTRAIERPCAPCSLDAGGRDSSMVTPCLLGSGRHHHSPVSSTSCASIPSARARTHIEIRSRTPSTTTTLPPMTDGEERKEAQRRNGMAQSRAKTALTKLHPEDYRRLYLEALDAVNAERDEARRTQPPTATPSPRSRRSGGQ